MTPLVYPTVHHSGTAPSDQPGQHAQPVIAYLSGSPGGPYNHEKWNMWRGIYQAANELGYRLIYISGEEFAYSPQAFLYQLVNSKVIHGIILWDSFFSPRSSSEEMVNFLDQYRPIPIVTIENSVPGDSCVLVDNYQGMKSVIDHLVNHHHYQQIAYITEIINHPANARRVAFEQIMGEMNLLDQSLVGSLAELGQRGKRAGVDYQAIVAHSDGEAGSVIERLRMQGVRVPEDVAVTGFNDGHEARSIIPALTTMRLPYQRMGRAAVRLLASRLQGDPQVRVESLPMHLILRSSCGCFEPLAENAAAGRYAEPARGLLAIDPEERDRLISAVSASMGVSKDPQSGVWAERLCDLFSYELFGDGRSTYLSGKNRQFLEGLQALLRQAIGEGININRWNEAISYIRNYFLPLVSRDQSRCLEDRCQQARVMIGQSAVRAEINRTWQSMQRFDVLREVISQLLVAETEGEFIDILVNGLGNLEIQTFFLVLTPNGLPNIQEAKIFLAYLNGKRIDLEEDAGQFRADEILPDRFLREIQPYSLLIEALYLGQEQFGYAVIQVEPPGDPRASDLYTALCGEISSAMKNLQLKQQLREAVKAAEEANQLKSRFLSMVSHELRTPINLIVGLSEMAIRQQTRGGKKSLAVLSRYLDQIFVSGQHLDRLIRDVLDLASSQVGQMNLINQPVDMSQLLNDAAVMGKQLAEQKNLQFELEIPPKLRLVWGDKTRLRQAVLNLLSNAVKFTARGNIRLSAREQDTQVIVSVSDTGLGIATDDLQIIFDEFSQSHRTVARGYGGIGLGLAITRKLIEMHGGSIWAESPGAEGAGSTFSFALPVLVDFSEHAVMASSLRLGQVVILTSDLAKSNVLIRHLKKHGFDVDIHPFGPLSELLELITNVPPGAIVLDLPPDTEEGWELIKILKENPGTQDIPVLFYSLFSDRDSGSVLDVDFMQKPLGGDQLVRALQRYGLKSGPKDETKIVLVIDDEPGILDLHAKIVETELPDALVLTASNGNIGLDIMRKERPDLVLLDLMMPELDGFGVIQHMQEDPVLRGIPVIVLTAQVLTTGDMNRLSKGVASVLAKGVFTRDEILQRIESTLSHKLNAGNEVHRLVRQAMAYIHEHYKEDISRLTIARHFCVNQQYLSRCFKKEIGIGPMAYLGRHRIFQAKRLLAQGDLTVTQVALEVGFASQSYFSRIFQQETGETPTSYMRGRRFLIK